MHFDVISRLLEAEEMNNLLSDREHQTDLSHQTCQAHPNHNRNKKQQLVTGPLLICLALILRT